jgi:UDP-N-acetylglucosamine:LPS N-acetylglucosamine transferase
MSGVSPAKEIFRDEVIAECKRVKKQLTIVGNDRVYQEPGIQSLAYQTTAQLQSLIADHHLIISRIGYTTIMDLCLMRKSALLVATPGQGEQEYLASYHKGKLFVIQENVDLSSAWKEIPAEIPLATEGYQHCIQEWLSGIKG